MPQKAFEKMKDSENIDSTFENIMNEVIFYNKVIDKVLLFLSHAAINVPKYWDKSIFGEEISHLETSFTNMKEKGDASSLAQPLFKILANMKLMI